MKIAKFTGDFGNVATSKSRSSVIKQAILTSVQEVKKVKDLDCLVHLGRWNIIVISDDRSMSRFLFELASSQKSEVPPAFDSMTIETLQLSEE